MTVALGARRASERGAARLLVGYGRTLVTRVGALELRVPQDRDGRFSTRLFERYQRSEKALVAALAEMYVQGVSTRKVKAITEELCGHAFSASVISAANKTLDAALAAFGAAAGGTAYPYLILDARYEKVREGGVIRPRAVQVAMGVDWEGRRNVLAVSWPTGRARRAGRSSWSGSRRAGSTGWSSWSGTTTRGSGGPSASAARGGLAALLRALSPQRARPSAARAGDDCLQELRWLYDAATSPRRARTSPAGSASGRRSTRSSATGSRRTSRRPSPTSACRSSTTST